MKPKFIQLLLLSVVLIIITGCATPSIKSEKTIVDSRRIATLRINLETAPSGASLMQERRRVCNTPCNIEVGYLEETTYNDGSKGRRGHLGGNFEWSRSGAYFTGAGIDLEWKVIPPPQYLVIQPEFCVHLHVVLEGYHPIDKIVCFNEFKDEVKKVNVVLEKR
jgi:hypothetical protein